MPGAVVTIAQQKGGAGKTTLAVQLGVAWASAGRRVAMLDVDPQASLVAWSGQRRRRRGEQAGGPVVHGLSGWRLGSELRRFRDEFELVVIDSPPHAETEVRAAIREADLVLVPCQPSALDLWASGPTIELAVREGARTLVVLNRMPARGRAAEAIRDEVRRNGWPLAAVGLGNRQAFAASILEGRGVCESAPSSLAGQEAAALAAEVLRTLAR